MKIKQQLADLQIASPDFIMVHASMRRIGVRAEYLLDILLDTISPQGTLMVYVDFLATTTVPWFDPKESPADPDYGIFAEIVRQHPDSIRSLNPGASVVAVGTNAKWLCANHPIDFGYGYNSPFHKLVEMDGKVVLLGSDFDHVTLLHYAEHIADLPNKRIVSQTYEVKTSHGINPLTCKEYDTGSPVLDAMPRNYFEQIVANFINQNRKVVTGTVGHARSWILPARDLIDFALEDMKKFNNE